MPKEDASPWVSNRRIARILLEASHDDPERPVRVRRAFRNFVPVRADLTHYDRDSKDLMKRFGVQALRDWAPLPTRLIVGYGFMARGFAKLTRGPDTFAVVLHTLGVPLPDVAAWATTAVEILGGAAVFTGLMIPIASIPLAVVLLAAIFTVHLRV